MKKVVLGLALATFTATTALAGTDGGPILEQEVAAQAADSSAGAGWVLALLTLAVIAAAAAD